MGLLQRLSQPVRFSGYGDQMHMVRHEAVSDEADSVERHVFPQELQVNRSIVIAVEDEAPPISALGDMMRDVQGDYAVKSSHGENGKANR